MEYAYLIILMRDYFGKASLFLRSSMIELILYFSEMLLWDGELVFILEELSFNVFSISYQYGIGIQK